MAKTKRTILGLDLGNNDVKTVHATLPSGFDVYTKIPFGADKYMLYDLSCPLIMRDTLLNSTRALADELSALAQNLKIK